MFSRKVTRVKNIVQSYFRQSSEGIWSPNRERYYHLQRYAGVIAAILVAIMLVVMPYARVSAAPLLLTAESFADTSTASGAWTFGGRSCLSAATVSEPGSIPHCTSIPTDDPGDGSLVLAVGPPNSGDNGFVVFNTPLSSNAGLQVSFDMAMYDGANGGGDGLAFFLIDGSATPSQAGGWGGGLGYSYINSGAVPGIEGAYVGVLFDVFGHASDPGNGAGGPGFSPNSIIIRGSEASGYQYIIGEVIAQSLDGTDKDEALRHVNVTISTTNHMRVSIDDGTGPVIVFPDIDLNTINGTGNLPPTLKFGFSASTGLATNVHTISNLVATVAPPDISAEVTTSASTVHRGQTFTMQIAGQNGQIAGLTSDTITMTSTLPTGIIPQNASGNGWVCDINGQTVTCSRPGSGADSIAAGSSMPPITLTLLAGQDAPIGQQVLSAMFTTANDDDLTNNTATAEITLLEALPGAPNTGLAPENALLPVLALLVGSGLIVSRIAPARRRIYGIFRK